MEVIIAKDSTDMGRKAAAIFAGQVAKKKDTVLGLATGSTFLEVYKAVPEFSRGVSFFQVRTVNLDEYVGLEASNKNSYRHYMNKNLFSKINIQQQNTHLPNGMAGNIDEECLRYDTLIEKLGGTDIQFLGLGMNGHIGFNEPSGSFILSTHCVNLSENTRSANAGFFGCIEAVPKQAITMGIKTIMQAKKIVLCVTGAQKAGILSKVLYGPVTPSVPGSILQSHNCVTVIADSKALRSV